MAVVWVRCQDKRVQVRRSRAAQAPYQLISHSTVLYGCEAARAFSTLCVSTLPCAGAQGDGVVGTHC